MRISTLWISLNPQLTRSLKRINMAPDRPTFIHHASFPLVSFSENKIIVYRLNNNNNFKPISTKEYLIYFKFLAVRRIFRGSIPNELFIFCLLEWIGDELVLI